MADTFRVTGMPEKTGMEGLGCMHSSMLLVAYGRLTQKTMVYLLLRLLLFSRRS